MITCKYNKCKEPSEWHFLLGVSISPAAWHEITEGFLRPSDVWPELKRRAGANVLDRVPRPA